MLFSDDEHRKDSDANKINGLMAAAKITVFEVETVVLTSFKRLDFVYYSDT